jgi:hypothetical protein
MRAVAALLILPVIALGCASLRVHIPAHATIAEIVAASSNCHWPVADSHQLDTNVLNDRIHLGDDLNESSAMARRAADVLNLDYGDRRHFTFSMTCLDMLRAEIALGHGLAVADLKKAVIVSGTAMVGAPNWGAMPAN